jgi:hypothetical protein
MSMQLTCPYCQYSKKVQREKIPAGVRWATCPRCHQRFELSLLDDALVSKKTEPWTSSERVGEGPEKEPIWSGAPWENRSEFGLWQGVYQTAKTALFAPESLFRTMTFTGGITEPLAFGILIGSIGTMFGLFWQFLMWSGVVLSSSKPLFGQFTIGVIFLIIMLVTPVFWVMWIFVSSAVMHLLLLIVRGGQNGYEATLRVVSYSQAAQIWCLIPLVGGSIGWIWQLVVQIIGLKQIHQTSYLRVFMALLIPVALFFLLGIVLVIGLIMFFR